MLKGKTPEELDLFVREQLAERTLHYQKAHHTINVDILDSYEKVDDVVQLILPHL